MRALLTAPFVGEIGWELMAWQGRVRRAFRQGGYDRLMVLGGARKSAFYDDMPLDYRTIDLSGLPGVAYEDRRCVPGTSAAVEAETLRELVRPHIDQAVQELQAAGMEVETFWPHCDGRFVPCDRHHQHFVRYCTTAPEPGPSPWVVLVKRTRDFGSQNWSPEDWDRIERGLRAHGIRTSTFPNDAAPAIEMLSACDLAVGQSTGGLHLAALCGCPRLVWSLEHYLWAPWDLTNRQRYETIWNPLGTPVQVHEVTRLPGPAEVVDAILETVHRIGRRADGRARRLAFRARWAGRNWLVKRLIQTRAYAHWPWPVQRWVRYRLI